MITSQIRKARLPRREQLWAWHLHRLVREVCLWDRGPVPEVLRSSSPVWHEDAEVGVRFQLELHDHRVYRHQLVWRGLLVGQWVAELDDFVSRGTTPRSDATQQQEPPNRREDR